jgi:hypothetical protein
MKRLKLNEIEKNLWQGPLKTIPVEVTSETRTIVAPYFLSSPDDEERAKNRADRQAALKRAVLLDELARMEAGLNRARGHAYLLGCAEEFESMLQMVSRVRSRLGR